jgi:hypothetical protein
MPSMLSRLRARFLFVLGLSLGACIAAEAQGIVAVHGLQPGDCVQFNNFDGWHTGTITKPEYGGGYQVSYQSAQMSTPTLIVIGANSRDIHRCTASTPPAAQSSPARTSTVPNRPTNTLAPPPPGTPAPTASAPHVWKVGDCVQFSYGGHYETATIAAPEYAGGYQLNWGKLKPTAPANDLRACPAGTANIQAGAMRQAGSGTGAPFGTRPPATCNRKVSINSSSVRQLVACDSEFVRGDNIHLITDLSVQLGSPRAYNAMQDSSAPGIDPHQPVYDIKGSYTLYQCTAVSPSQTPYAQTHNCTKYPATAGGYGRCYTDTFGDKHCLMTGGGPTQLIDQPPPAN